MPAFVPTGLLSPQVQAGQASPVWLSPRPPQSCTPPSSLRPLLLLPSTPALPPETLGHFSPQGLHSPAAHSHLTQTAEATAPGLAPLESRASRETLKLPRKEASALGAKSAHGPEVAAGPSSLRSGPHTSDPAFLGPRPSHRSPPHSFLPPASLGGVRPHICIKLTFAMLSAFRL